MSKTMTVLFFLIVSLLMGAIGYLGYEVSELKAFQATTQTEQKQLALDFTKVSENLGALTDRFNAQKQVINGFTNDLTQFEEDLKLTTSKKYMPAISYQVEQPLFTTKEEDNQIAVLGDRNEIDKWLNKNELFLDHVIKKSLPLEYDRLHRNVVVQDIIPESIFYQMGLRNGDRIVLINGQVINQGVTIRQKLIDTKPKKVLVIRDNKKVMLDIEYKDQVQNQTNNDQA